MPYSRIVVCLFALLFFSLVALGQTKPNNNISFGVTGAGGPVASGVKMVSAVDGGLPFTFSLVSPVNTTGSVMYIGQPSSGGWFRSGNAFFFNYTTGNIIPGNDAGSTGTGDYRLHFTNATPADTGVNKLGNFGMQSIYLAIGTGKTADVVIEGYRAGRRVAQSTITGLSTNNMSLQSMSTTDLFYASSDAYSGVTISFGSNWQFLDGLRFKINDRNIPLHLDDINFNTPNAVAPATQASAVSFTNTTGITSTINWTKGSGDRTAVFMSAVSSGAPDLTPTDPVTTYTPNTAYGSGTQTANGWSCVYNSMDNASVIPGTTNSVNVTNLTPGTTYRVMVVSYDGTADYSTYNTSQNPGGTVNLINTTTVAIPTTQASNISITPNYTDFKRALISWTRGNGVKSAVFVKNNTPGETVSSTVEPPHNDNNTTEHTYLPFTDTTAVTLNGRVGTTGWYCVYNNAGSGSGLSTSVSMTKITISPGQTLRVMVVEYNGAAGAETYNITSASNNVIDYFNPDYPLPVTTAASGISISAATLNGTIDPRGGNISSGNYVYSTSSTLATTLGTITTLTPVATSILGSASATAVAGSLTGLSPSTTYYYRLSATSNAGTGTATNSTSGATNGIRSFTTAPIVSSVSASSANGSYKAGQVLALTVVFTSAITVTGNPTLALNSGGTATYAAGSGSTTLSFNYTIASAESSIDLDYNDITSLSLSGGTLKDGAGTDASLTLPAPASANSLGGLKNIVIDTQTPAISAVTITSDNINNVLAKPGNIISLTITATEPISIPVVTISGEAATVTGDGTSWNAVYTMTAAQSDGAITFKIDYSDIAGNLGAAVTATTNNSTVTYDKTSPMLSAVKIISNNTNPSTVRSGNLITLTFTSTEAVSTSATIAGHIASITNTGLNSHTASYTFASGDAASIVPFTITFNDLAGNPGVAINTTTDGSNLTAADAPTAITIIPSVIYENQAAGALAGTLSSSSADAMATFTYSLVSGSGSTDNVLFNISGNDLKTVIPLDYESKAAYSILVRSTTQYGFFLDKQFTVTISDLNEAPTLSIVPNQTVCQTINTQSIPLSGISAGPETGQNTSLSVSTDKPALFDLLSISGSTLNYRLSANATGTASITIVVKDDGGISNSGTDTFSRIFTLTVNPLPLISIVSDIGTDISKGDVATLTAFGGDTYQWSAGSNIIGTQSSISVRPDQATIYKVTVTNASGCTSSQDILITVKEDYKLDLSNIVTPDGDGKNDFLVIKNLDTYPNNTMRIFDRSGRKIYEKKTYANDWAGTMDGNPLAPDTYFYILDFGNASIGPVKGFVSIISR